MVGLDTERNVERLYTYVVHCTYVIFIIFLRGNEKGGMPLGILLEIQLVLFEY